MSEGFPAGSTVRLLRDVGDRKTGATGTFQGYYADSGRAVVTFADGTVEVPGDAIEAADEGTSPRHDPPAVGGTDAERPSRAAP